MTEGPHHIIFLWVKLLRGPYLGKDCIKLIS
jgi:hypothetical protein